MTVSQQLQNLLHTRHDDVVDWFMQQWQRTPPAPFNSVDVRDAGYKIAPVDTNLFPAGFNNLTDAAKARASLRMQPLLQAHGRKLLILPEEHTRNLKYLDAVLTLQDIAEAAGAEVQLGLPTLTEPLTLESAAGRPLTLHPLQRQGNQLVSTSGFTPDWVLLNNDMTGQVYAELADLQQPVLPHPNMGWHRRKKTTHFGQYQEVVRDFAKAFALDGWWLQADYRHCGKINFMEMTGVECVASNVEKLVEKLKTKYTEAGITQQPYVFIKANSGTYGMGIMTARSAEEVLEMNRKDRKKMHAIKGGNQNTDVIIQEGIPTISTLEGGVTEQMVYLAGGCAIGGAFRGHATRGAEENLNAVGMRFQPFPEEGLSNGCCLPANYALSPHFLIAQLAALAAAREMTDAINPQVDAA